MFQIIDLVQVQLMFFRWVEGYTMIDRQRNVAALKERDDVIRVLERSAARRNYYWPFRRRYFFNENPVIHIRTRNLDNGDYQFDTHVDGRLVKRRGHWNARGLLDRLHEQRVVVLRHSGIDCLLDISKVGPLPEILVDKVLNVSKLKFDCRADIVKTD